MVKRLAPCWVVVGVMLSAVATAAGQQAGSIRGMVYDKDFDAPLALAQVTIAETGEKVTATDQGNYVFPEVPPGTYTLVFSKEGYTRQVKADVVVQAGQVTEVDGWLSGEFTEMEEFVVQDLQVGGGEAALLDLRVESPALMDSISSDLMSKAGLGDAASALKLVPGATVQEGKYAVIRGLPDRYVNSQMNGVRLPTADVDKRAVQLDQFPSDVIESVRVSKTFTPDQQGDASGGAVNVILKGIPNETVLKLGGKYSHNTQVKHMHEFLSYKRGGVTMLGREDTRGIPLGSDSFTGALGVSREESPVDYDWSLTAGGKRSLIEDVKVGGLMNFFYKRDSFFYDRGLDDSFWVENPGDPLTPQKHQIAGDEDFKTALWDIVKGKQEVQWGSLLTAGIEGAGQSLAATYMYTRIAEDTAILAENTRGKEYYFPKDYSRNDSFHEGNVKQDMSPYLRTETLKYSERITETFQIRGTHKAPIGETGFDRVLMILPPEADWTFAHSTARLYEPDKRQFGSMWWPKVYKPGFPPWVMPFETEEVHRPYKPSANFTLGNVQRVWKEIKEESDQYSFNLKFPFRQWTETEGYVKVGRFNDVVERTYDQESFSNFNDNAAQYEGPWEEFWSAHFPWEEHPMTGAEIDVDYRGHQKITAWYWMTDFPICKQFKVIWGSRFEKTALSIKNEAEEDVTWVPLDGVGIVKLEGDEADVNFKRRDMLGSIGGELKPIEQISLRGTFAHTVARQTFKELTPIQQMEFLGADIFIGNPGLQMSHLRNWDLRLDYTPYKGGLISASYFKKDIKDPIEYVQRNAGFTYTMPVNYPDGTLHGWEFEVRQDLGHLWSPLRGLSIGGNTTLINSEVTLPEDEAEQFEDLDVPMPTREMVNAPKYLYNIFVTYNIEKTGTELAAFYTVKGDTLVAGAGQSGGNFVPNVYAMEHDTLNVSVTQGLGKYLKLKFQAKNLTNPHIRTEYRSDYVVGQKTRTNYQEGVDLSIGLYAEFTF
ncbi:MAG: carboxypeptidase regulatory-like domain-containing protein [Planctomycetes bacterium]|nr:carboxypeptidase regulatory-like domain-containing protein [Planctomycetota bacterium]